MWNIIGQIQLMNCIICELSLVYNFDNRYGAYTIVYVNTSRAQPLFVLKYWWRATVYLCNASDGDPVQAI